MPQSMPRAGQDLPSTLFPETLGYILARSESFRFSESEKAPLDGQEVSARLRGRWT